ncbi:MAG: SGNH/GDSL hydrolase family protein [Sphingobacteriales bacterium]
MKIIRLTLVAAAIICFASCQTIPTYNSPQPVIIPHIVILGSSSASGDGATPIDSAWAFRLQSTINQNGTKATFTNLAVPGYVTFQAMPTGYNYASRPAPDTAHNLTKALSLHPTLVMISFPTNDIADNYTDDEIMRNFAVMAHQLDSAKVQYILFGTQPRNFTDAAQRMRLKKLNDKIIAAYGAHVNDILAPLSTSTYDINPTYSAGDGIHVNNSGHALIVTKVLQQPIFIQVTGVQTSIPK